MSDPAKAVFLSYASQDAEAAKRICDALRAAGVEVWFDAEGGLEHGDEWDAKIRRQIKECVLFLPVISANTQAREEGYFRIEWELAAQRALGIASGVAFILPIVIDDTREPDALVPDRFRSVQWTRLRGGELTPEVKMRFLKLWSHRTGALRHQSGVGASLDDARGRAQGAPLQSKPGWKVYAGLAAAIFAVVAGAAWWMLRPGSAPAALTDATPAPISSPARATRDWPKDPEFKKAFAIITGLDATIESCRLAEDMINAVLKQRPTDAEATTLYAMLNNYYINRGYDASEERQVLARRFSERALQLAPDEPEALAAMAQFLAFRGSDFARADTLIRKAMALAPQDPRFARILVYNVLRPTNLPRALALAKEDAARFPADPLTQYDLALICRTTGDLALMEEAIDRTLALAPISSALIWKGWLAAWVHGDLPGFKGWLDRISGNYRFNERAVYMHYLYACLSGDTAYGHEALEAFPGSWLNDFYYTGPRSLLQADLLALAGKPELAQVEYGRALAEIGRMAERDSQGLAWRAEFWALRGAGREADARAAAKRMMQRLNRPYRPPIMQWWHDVIPAQLLAGERADALALIREAAMVPAVRAQIRTALKIDYRMAPFRDDPEIQALLGDAAKTVTARDWPKDPDLKQAIALTEGLEAIPDDLTLAEEITKRVLDRSPMDVEAVTVMARVQSHFLRRGFDRSDERAAQAKRYAERALQLAPDEPEAMYALATYHFSRVTGETARTEQLLRRAMELDPTSPRPGRLLADLYNATNRPAEAITQGQDNVRRFPRDVLSHYDLARNYKDQGRYDEFDRELDATLALAPLPNAIVWKARLQFGLRNDFAGMKTWLDQVPPRVRGTERAVFGYFLYAAFGGDPEAGLAALRDFPQKWFTDFEYAGPTALLNASLLQLQGKRELALRQFEVAQGEIQRMRQTDPGRIGLSQVEFWTLLGLGRTEEAKASFRRMVEGNRRPYAQDMVNGWWFTSIPAALLIGDRATALTLLRESVATQPESRAAFRLRFQIDPRMAPFRDDPEIKALLADPGSGFAASAAKIDDKSVAVLAFANLSSDKEQEYFSDGISEELLNVLAKVPGLKVTARTSSFFFKGKDTPIPEIAQKLGVAYVVEGSVRKAGDKVRITAQLIKAADGFHVWSETFTRDLKDIFAVQDEIAGLIAQNFKVNVGLASPAARRAVNPEAHRLLLEGRHFWNLRTMEDFDRAEAALSQAIELDPDFVQAHAALADVRWVRTVFKTYSGFNYVPGTYVGKETARAQALDPMLAEAYPAAGAQLHWNGRAEEAGQLFRKAITLNPNYALAHHWYSLVLEGQGRLDEALAEIERALDLDPLSLAALSTRVRYLFAAGRVAEALSAYDKVLALRKNYFFSIGVYAQALLATGRREEALAVARSICARESMEVRYVGDAQAVFVLRALGHEAEAVAHVERLLPRLPADSYLRGVALASVDRLDEAIPYLERTPPGLTEIFYWNKTWDRWRDDPRFLRLLAKLNCTEEYKVARAILARMQLAAAKK